MNKKKILIFMLVILTAVSTKVLAGSQTYTVMKGDTLYRIGKNYGVDWKEIQRENKIKNVYRLQIGTVLTIPETGLGTNVEKVSSKPSYDSERIMIQNGDHQIPAIITIPEGNGPFPAVVMLHGTGSNKDEAGNGYVEMAKTFADHNIASIRFDFIGNGESQEDYIHYNFKTAKDDCQAVTKYLMDQKKIDKKRIGIMGWSQGGTIALLAAAENNTYRSVLTWAGAIDLASMNTDENYAIAKEQGYYPLEFDWRDPLKLGLEWFEDVRNTDLKEELGKIEVPILAIHGSEDNVVDPKVGDIIVKAAGNKNSKKKIIKGADHTFNIFTEDKEKFEKLETLTKDWFEQTL
ncbi:MAG: alpha/beta fold hydrolase [Tissierellia bacterium]|nr:alpha/beta fold hydrolase [Tissierellia bacterium]